MSREPERLHVLRADLIDDRRDDVLQVLVVFGGPDPARRKRRRDDETVLVLVVEDRKVVALPVAVRPGAVQAEYERHLLALLQIARVVEKVVAPGLRLDDRTAVGHHVAGTLRVRTVQRRRLLARRAREAKRLRVGGGRQSQD